MFLRMRIAFWVPVLTTKRHVHHPQLRPPWDCVGVLKSEAVGVGIEDGWGF